MILTDLSAKEIATGYREKEFSAVDVAKAHLKRIEQENPKLNAYLEVFDDVEEKAQEADKRLAAGQGVQLTGVPIAIKDNILIEGKIASAASKMLEHHVATYDATAIKKLKESGAIFLGRTNMDEFAMGGSTENSAFGPTRNPVDTSRVPGGTSGGSAAAVAARLAPVALGTDTGGSVRQPASYCGVLGFKPTYGAVSRYGLIAMGSSLDQLGIHARTVDDIQTVFDVVKGKDIYDATSLPDAPAPKADAKIGVPRAFVKDANPDVVAAFEKSLAELAGKGYEIMDIELPTVSHALAAYYIIMPAEVSTNLSRFDGVRYGLHVGGTNLLEDYKKSRAAGFGAEVKRRIILGTYILSHGYYDAYYRRAGVLRSQLISEFENIFKDLSYIATPTAPSPAFKIGEKGDPLSMYLEDIFTVPANLTGMPALSVPAGTVARDGVDLPVGIQFTAPRRMDHSLFAVARDLLGEKSV